MAKYIALILVLSSCASESIKVRVTACKDLGGNIFECEVIGGSAHERN